MCVFVIIQKLFKLLISSFLKGIEVQIEFTDSHLFQLTFFLKSNLFLIFLKELCMDICIQNKKEIIKFKKIIKS